MRSRAVRRGAGKCLEKLAQMWHLALTASFCRPAVFLEISDCSTELSTLTRVVDLVGGDMRLALFEPDIPQNSGAMMRLAAALGIGFDVIEPCGFVLDDRRLRRVAMDYLRFLDWRRYESWACFCDQRPPGRLVLLTTRGELGHLEVAWRPDDTILVGRESAGVPDAVHRAADLKVVVPLRPPARALNVVTAAAIVLGEALRQTGGFAAVAATQVG